MSILCNSDRLASGAGTTASVSGGDAIFLAAWCNFVTVKKVSAAVCLAESDANSDAAYLGTAGGGDGQLSFKPDRATGSECLFDFSTTGSWVQYAGLELGSERRLFASGSLQATQSDSTDLADVDTVVLANRPGLTGQSLDSQIAEVGIWVSSSITAAIGAEMAAQLADGVSPLQVRPEWLRNYYPLYNSNYLIDVVSGDNLSVVSGSIADGASHPPVFYQPQVLYFPQPVAAGGGGGGAPIPSSLLLTGVGI